MQDSVSDVASECSTSGQNPQHHTVSSRPASVHHLLALAESAGTDWKVSCSLFEVSRLGSMCASAAVKMNVGALPG